MNSWKSLLLAVLSMAALGLHGGAQAQTLEKISKSKTLNIGVREDSLPFAAYSQGVASGYSVDLCRKVADQLKKDLKLSELRVQYVVVTAADRIAKLRDGAIDIECGTAVHTQERAKEVDFSTAHFIGGARFLSRKASGLSDYTQLNGQTVAIIRGTTAEKLFTQLQADSLRNMKLVAFNRNQDAMKALESGAVVAVAQLDILLEGMRQASAQPDLYVVSGKSLSIEPMTLMVRKDDTAFRSAVDKVLVNLYSSGEISAIYDRWFKNERFNVPVSTMLADCFRRPCRSPATALGLGYML